MGFGSFVVPSAAMCWLCVMHFAGLAPSALASTCGGYPKTECTEDHLCCAIDSGDDAGFCCPKTSRRNQTMKCAFGIDGLGLGVLSVRNCCEGHPVCGVGVGARWCCMGPRSKLSASGCSAVGPNECCNSMCGDDICDSECKWLGGTCKVGSSAEGGSCTNATSGLPVVVPPMV